MSKDGRQKMADEEYFVSMDWLFQRVSVEEIEATNKKDEKELTIFQLHFRCRNEWMRLKVQMIDGDELWYFSSPAPSWQHLWGRGGIALVRGGKTIDGIVTVKN
jgi:hypothetical protein